MKLALTIAQAVLGVAVSLLILVQSKGTGLGRSIGSQTYHSRRGLEHFLFRITIILVVAFVCLSAIQLFVK
jgi:protein translocase SecG subunit